MQQGSYKAVLVVSYAVVQIKNYKHGVNRQTNRHQLPVATLAPPTLKNPAIMRSSRADRIFLFGISQIFLTEE
jgi:hypothetical protein